MRLHLADDLFRLHGGRIVGRPIGHFFQKSGAIVAPVEMVVAGFVRRDTMVAELDELRRLHSS